jgi:type II secretory pathway pseudopilin PulG
MSSSSDRARGGFVLLEAVVALAIIGVVSIALLETTGTQLRAAGQAKTLLVARTLAEDRIAALQLLDYDGLQDPPDSLLAGTFGPPFEAYTWTSSVETMEDEYDLFGVQVTVEGNGESFPLRTLIHSPRPGVQVNGAQGTQGGDGGFGGGRGGRGGDGRAGRGATDGRGGFGGGGRGFGGGGRGIGGGGRGGNGGRGGTGRGGVSGNPVTGRIGGAVQPVPAGSAIDTTRAVG